MAVVTSEKSWRGLWPEGRQAGCSIDSLLQRGPYKRSMHLVLSKQHPTETDTVIYYNRDFSRERGMEMRIEFQSGESRANSMIV